jgi:hypothetical protein
MDASLRSPLTRPARQWPRHNHSRAELVNARRHLTLQWYDLPQRQEPIDEQIERRRVLDG